MPLLNKIVTTGGAVIATVGVSLGAVEGSPGLLAIGLGSPAVCSRRLQGHQERTTNPSFCGLVEASCSSRMRRRVKNAMMDGNLAATAVEATTRVLILEVAVILTALMAALATVIVGKSSA